MAGNGNSDKRVVDYRHKNVKRLNIPPAGLAARGDIVKEKKIKFAYNPHLSPALRFDPSGGADKIEELIQEAGKRKLEPDELRVLQEALRDQEPWLEWAGKREQQWCVADPVALHMHERVSTQAILRTAKRQDVQRSLFADPEMDYAEAVQFYKWPMDWTNRMILGDSLAVMASLARREALAGKVQMIYIDPPYGIKYASNFQSEVGRRDVKDRDEDLTREPEMVKAYRDTWTLGVHSYLSYLRDRLLLCKEMLADFGSIFMQIGDENIHRVRAVMDEVFGPANFISLIQFRKTAYQATDYLANTCDFMLWYSKDKASVKVKHLYFERPSDMIESGFTWVEDERGMVAKGKTAANIVNMGKTSRFQSSNLTSQGASDIGSQPYSFGGRVFDVGANKHWKTSQEGLGRLAIADRLFLAGSTLSFKRFADDFPLAPFSNMWSDTIQSTFAIQNLFVVQTSTKVVERCLLMTTDPGDLVLDPTCGSGTTALVAEEWGRRWITIDVSRVAIAIARQRLLTQRHDYYRLRPTSAEDIQRNPDGPWLSDPEGQIQGTCTLDCRTVPHVTLKSIAQNQALDPVFEKWEAILAGKLDALNQALQEIVTDDLRKRLLAKLQDKTKAEGKRAVTDADERRWLLPPKNRKGEPFTTVPNAFPGWYEWEVPFDSDPEWPEPLKAALVEYRSAWRQKMDEVNGCIDARADQEELVDQPLIERGKIRVSGPFTVEGVIPAEESIDVEESPIGGAPEEMETFEEAEGDVESDAQNAEAYIDRMIRLLREDGVGFAENKVEKFTTLEALNEGSVLHAKGTWGEGENQREVAVMFGPQYGPLIAQMVEEGIRIASRRGYDDLVFAGFAFDGAAQVAIQEDPDPKIRIHMAHIRPDVTMGNLLKTTVSSQIFTVSGSPRTRLEQTADGEYVVHMEGVDIYDPVTNAVRPTSASKVAAWFLDTDYDGRCFCVTQAFFPDKSAWEKLGKALGGAIDQDAFDALSGTASLPFRAGEHKLVAVKVIDPRGNEVMRMHRLGGGYE